MWKLFLSFIVIGLLNCGLAQSYWGVRAEAYLPAVWFPLPAFQIGWETDAQNTGVGIRASLMTLLIANRASLDAYGRVALGDGSSVYVGAGLTTFFAFLGILSSFDAWPYGVLGYQWREPDGSNLFVEVNPSVLSNGQFVMVLMFGVNRY